MSDPLSIAASVGGLLALSDALYNRISAFIQRIQNAPQSAFALSLSVSEVRIALISVSGLINSFMDVPLRRRAMVQLDHLVICLTQLVLAFDELERFVGTWPEDIQLSWWKRWRFSGLDEKMTRLNMKIQQQKTSISLVLNILQCESDIEARSSGESLRRIMQTSLEQNNELRSQLEWLGSGMRSTRSTARSVNTILPVVPSGDSQSNLTFHTQAPEDEDDTSTIRNRTELNILPEPDENITSGRMVRTLRTSLDDRSSFRLGWRRDSIYVRSFENILAKSFVYARVRSDECDVSFTTNQSRSGLWSLLSGLSLSQVSSISVIALPISRADIGNDSWYKPTKEMYTITILGQSFIGKSALATRFCYESFYAPSHPTIEDNMRRDFRVDGVVTRIHVCDITGRDEYEILTQGSIEKADAFIIAHSMLDWDSFISAQSLYRRVANCDGPQKPIAMVATKSDQQDQRSVIVGVGCSFATQNGCKYFECSAKTGAGVDAPFLELVRSLRVKAAKGKAEEETNEKGN